MGNSFTTAQGASGRDLTPDGLKKCDCFAVGNYTKTRKLGSGAFSTVYLARKKKSAIVDDVGVCRAIKVIQKEILTPEDKEGLHSEIAILLELKSPLVMALYEVYESPTAYQMVTELIEGGELFERIVEKEKYTEKEARDVVRNMVEAVGYLHKHGRGAPRPQAREHPARELDRRLDDQDRRLRVREARDGGVERVRHARVRRARDPQGAEVRARRRRVEPRRDRVHRALRLPAVLRREPGAALRQDQGGPVLVPQEVLGAHLRAGEGLHPRDAHGRPGVVGAGASDKPKASRRWTCAELLEHEWLEAEIGHIDLGHSLKHLRDAHATNDLLFEANHAATGPHAIPGRARRLPQPREGRPVK